MRYLSLPPASFITISMSILWYLQVTFCARWQHHSWIWLQDIFLCHDDHLVGLSSNSCINSRLVFATLQVRHRPSRVHKSTVHSGDGTRSRKLPEGGGIQWKGCKLLQNTEEELSVMEIEPEHQVMLLVDATESSNNDIMLVWSGCRGASKTEHCCSLIMLRYTCVCVPSVNNQN